MLILWNCIWNWRFCVSSTIVINQTYHNFTFPICLGVLKEVMELWKTGWVPDVSLNSSLVLMNILDLNYFCYSEEALDCAISPRIWKFLYVWWPLFLQWQCSLIRSLWTTLPYISNLNCNMRLVYRLHSVQILYNDCLFFWHVNWLVVKCFDVLFNI